MTGTPLDLTPFGVVLQGIGALYWLFAVGLLALALFKPTTWSGRAIAAALVVGVFSFMPVKQYLAVREAQEKQRAAWEHFQMRCKEAGERIVRRDVGVEGVLLMKIRSHVDVDSQFTADDVYGYDNVGEDYIKSFLRVVAGLHLVSDAIVERYRQGYRWVEATDPKDGKPHRFSLVGDVERLRSDETWVQAKKNIGPDVGREVYGLVLKRQPIDRPMARYGVTWADISTREDRTHWVAGGVIQVINLQTQEVIAERKGFMWDYGMGSRAGGRSPWLFAQRHACPAFPERGPGDPRRERTRREGIEFVQKVLEPTAKE